MVNKLNNATLSLIRSFEGLELEAYKDPVGIWTIGYGHTSMAGPPSPKAGMKITKQEAEALLIKDLVKYEEPVRRLVKVPLNDNQYGALVSFTYNLGEGNFSKSTLLKKLNKGDYDGAANEFAKWNKAGGKVLKGLVRRREAEASLFRMPLLATEKFADKPPVIPAPQVPEKPKASPTPPVSQPKAKWWIDAILYVINKLFKGK